MIHAFDFELKELDEKGTFTGLAATYGNEDLVADRLMRGAFTRTLQTSSTRPLLMGHKDPCGVVSLKDSHEGLIANGRLSLGVQVGRDAYQLLKDGVLRSLSIGFLPVRDEIKGGVRHLIECKLFEVSLVAVPANELAMITSVKGLVMDDVVRRELASARKDIERAIQAR